MMNETKRIAPTINLRPAASAQGRLIRILKRIGVYGLFIALALIAIYPIVWLAINALKTEIEMFEASWALPTTWRWTNYQRAWDFGIARYFLNSILVTGVSVVLTVLVSLMAAFAFARFRFRGQTFLLFFVLGGLMVAPEVSLIPLFQILKTLNIYNTYFAMILPYVAYGIPFTTFLARSYILGLPRDFEEAAYMDGAGPLALFRYIIVPLSRPIIASASLIEAMHFWNEFMFALTFIESERLKTLPIGMMSFVSALRTEWTVVMAGLVLAALPMILLFLLAQRHFVRGLSAGGVKG